MDFKKTAFLFGYNAPFLEELYELYENDPSSVDESWRDFFKNSPAEGNRKSKVRIIGEAAPSISSTKNYPEILASSEKELRAKFLIESYRRDGHLVADLDPLGIEKPMGKQEAGLNFEKFGFSIDNLKEEVEISFASASKYKVGDLINSLDKVYSGSVGVEFSQVEDPGERGWLYENFEKISLNPTFSQGEKKNILDGLTKVELFEQYLHTKFPGAKRFSIEGGDVFVPALKRSIEISAKLGTEEVVVGMAHRGRLSTLAGVMEKPFRAIFYEFMGNGAFPKDLDVSGDVKYHMGYSSDVIYEGKKIHLSLSPNPSHLEAVNPVVSGRVRAKQDLIGDLERKKILGILVHGDAAFCGQGVVAENLISSGLPAYNVGGIIHFVINNQVGFTANARDTRPGRYSTDVAKIVGAPILHVNGDDAEAVMRATDLACLYGKKFGKDVVIDIICYRKYGHNEGDEPMYTQAPMYNIIKNKITPASIYASKLISESAIDSAYFDKIKSDFKKELDSEYSAAKDYVPYAQWLEGAWAGYSRSCGVEIMETGVDKGKLKEIGKKIFSAPPSFDLNPKLAKLLEHRSSVLAKEEPMDWAIGEALAFGSILSENFPIRMTGEDCGRGTFSHRHSVLHSQSGGKKYVPLNNISESQASFFVADSYLSEYGVLGFEYGYSLVNPKNLVIWEAQFGDFANGAQIIFDQFISSAETKWLRMSGLVILLPHGYEGQGPEHSSARLERFLQLAAEDNMKIAYPTTPASIFHLLRGQALGKIRKPLIIMSPKSLLRHKLAVSSLDEIGAGTSFKPLLEDPETKNPERIVFCAGKIYYDLLEKRAELSLKKNIALVRLELLYPFPEKEVLAAIAKYKGAKEFVFCQEEPKNMGSWNYLKEYLDLCLAKAGIGGKFLYVGRPASASPAAGALYTHNREQEKLVNEALKIGSEK